MVTVINLKLLLESRFWSFPLVASVILSVSLYIIVNIGMAFLWVSTYFLNAMERMTYYKEETFIKDGVKFETRGPSGLSSFPMNMQLLRYN